MHELKSNVLADGEQKQAIPEDLAGFAHVAVTKVDHNQTSQFVKNYIQLDPESYNLELF